MASTNTRTHIVKGRKGLTIVLASKARIELAHKINDGLKQHTLKGVAEASTLSPETIITRSHDTGRSASGERMSLWSFVGLCEGLHMDPHALAKQTLDIELADEDIRRAKDALDLRRLRQAKEQRQRSPEQATFHGNGDTASRFADALVGNVAQRLESRIEELVEQKLLELLTRV